MPLVVSGPAADEPWGKADPDDDLSFVLHFIARDAQAKTRAKLANSSETRGFLELGLAILRADLLEHSGSDLDVGERTRIFESVSRSRLIELAAEWDAGRERKLLLGETQFRSRWVRKEFYAEDLIAYIFRRHPQELHIAEIADAASELMRTESLGGLVRLLAATELDSVMSDTISGIQAAVQSALPMHPRVQEFVRAQYDYLLPRWASIYQEVAQSYGLIPAPGTTFNDIALLFNTVIEGVSLRARVGGGEPELSSGVGAFEGAIRAMLPSLLANCPKNIDECMPVSREGP
jgi:hypothetical protein